MRKYTLYNTHLYTTFKIPNISYIIVYNTHAKEEPTNIKISVHLKVKPVLIV